MKTVSEVMTTEVIHVGPANKIKTAIILMKGHNIGGLPVVDEERVVGMLDYHAILGKDNDIPVQNIMDREFVSIPQAMTVADAADLMAKLNASRLVVMNNGQIAGIVTRGDLLPELGKSVDPITGLPRADAMRDWGIAALKRGVEVTVLFLDLDQFGQFNKKYGHIVGDNVLKHVAGVLLQNVDPDLDMVCRYAGDEFVIVTLRNQQEARELADILEYEIRNTPNSELPEPVSGSIGVHGGMRTKEREDIHYNATLDNLINLASKSCTLAKEQHMAKLMQDAAGNLVDAPAEDGELSQQTPVPEIAPVEEFDVQAALAQANAVQEQAVAQLEALDEALTEEIEQAKKERRLKLRGLNFSWDDNSVATAAVELVDGEFVARQSCSGFAMGPNALRLVADATANAICVFLPSPGYGVVTETVHIINGNSSGDIALVTALLVTPNSQTRLSGSSIIKQDVYRAVSAAMLDAVNRQISLLI